MKALIVAAVMLAACSPVSSAPSATPAARETLVPTATASPTPTVAAGPTRYVNAELGYSVDLPAGWRRATCSEEIAKTSPPLTAFDVFVGVPDSQEVIRGGVRLIIVSVTTAEGVTAEAWLKRNASQPGAQIEPATLGDRSGARSFLGATGHTYAFAVAARGRIYAIQRTVLEPAANFGIEGQELEGMLTSFRVLDDATVDRGPIATPTPRSIESLVDALADAFARKDPIAIADTMTPCVGLDGQDMRSRTAYVTTIEAEFAAGASVQVSKPIESDPLFGRVIRSTFSTPGKPTRRVDFLFREDSGRWSVVGVLNRR
ncbi:MAG: hypothetical protein M3T56_04020 [Chloroflexota bacterium]|nr:hypothetical protein [Chloroflexota bacterium]